MGSARKLTKRSRIRDAYQSVAWSVLTRDKTRKSMMRDALRFLSQCVSPRVTWRAKCVRNNRFRPSSGVGHRKFYLCVTYGGIFRASYLLHTNLGVMPSRQSSVRTTEIAPPPCVRPELMLQCWNSRFCYGSSHLSSLHFLFLLLPP